MAKYTINHTCGHIVTIQLFGAYKDRERRIAWLETQECEECRKEKANAAAAQAKAKRGLADLTGSEKQVAWANTIREGAYKALDCLAPFTTNNQARQMVESWKAKMDAETSAKWWINHRSDMPEAFSNATSEQAAATAARIIIAHFVDLFNK